MFIKPKSETRTIIRSFGRQCGSFRISGAIRLCAKFLYVLPFGIVERIAKKRNDGLHVWLEDMDARPVPFGVSQDIETVEGTAKGISVGLSRPVR